MTQYGWAKGETRHKVREDISIDAWRAVQRVTPEVATQEPQAIAEMIAHLEAMQFAAGDGWGRIYGDEG